MRRRAWFADRWERLVTLVPALALLIAAVILASVSDVLLAGVLLAASPGLLLVVAGLGGSGLEAAAALALTTALLAPAAAPSCARPAFLLAAVAAPCLVLARSMGPVWLALVVAACAPLAWGWLRTAGPRWWAPAGAVTVAAVVAQRIWEAKYGPSLPHVGIPPAVESLKYGIKHLPHTLREAVGSDGYLHWLAPWPIAGLWLGGVIALCASALRGVSTGARAHLAVVVAAVVASAPLLFATVIVYTGFKVQARHIFALLVLVPLLAAAYVAINRRPAAWPARLPILAGLVDGTLAIALAHHYSAAGYAPALGWPVVVGLSVIGAGLVAGA